MRSNSIGFCTQFRSCQHRMFLKMTRLQPRAPSEAAPCAAAAAGMQLCSRHCSGCWLQGVTELSSQRSSSCSLQLHLPSI